MLEEISEKIKEKATLEFGLVGKTSKADFLAGQVLVKKKKPKLVLSEERLLKKIKKTEVGKRLKNT